jgi:hypothetical protein
METADLTGLKPEDAALVKEFVPSRNARARPNQALKKHIRYHAGPLGMKTAVTRRQIWEHLSRQA